MKTGVEIIAEAIADYDMEELYRCTLPQERAFAVGIKSAKGFEWGDIKQLAEAGALIAAEIDRLNDLKQG